MIGDSCRGGGKEERKGGVRGDKELLVFLNATQLNLHPTKEWGLVSSNIWVPSLLLHPWLIGFWTAVCCSRWLVDNRPATEIPTN